MNENVLSAAYAAFDTEGDALLRTKNVLDRAELMRAVEVLAQTERIAASGCGHSGIACRHFAHLMCCIGRPARFLSPSEALHGGMGFFKPGDAFVWASRGGKTDELVPIVDTCRAFGVTVIGVTENLESPLARKSDILLAFSVTKECDRENCQGTTSFALTCAVFDALQTALIEYTGFTKETFALIHPGGAVGKRLNSAADEKK